MTTVDCGEVYERSRLALVDLVRSLDGAQLATTVPATPAWTVRDVLAHVVGITADLNAQRFPAGDPEAWTAAQVSSREGWSVEELAAEWDREAPAFEDGLRLFGHELGSHYVGDLLQHTQDVRSALGLPPLADDDPALAVGLDHYLHTAHLALGSDHAVEITAADGATWTLGDGPVVARLGAPRLELFRALGGRRTEAEVRACDWEGDVDAVLPSLSAYPMPAAPLPG